MKLSTERKAELRRAAQEGHVSTADVLALLAELDELREENRRLRRENGGLSFWAGAA